MLERGGHVHGPAEVLPDLQCEDTVCSCSAAVLQCVVCSVATSCWMSLRVSATRNTNTVSQAIMRNLSTETEM